MTTLFLSLLWKGMTDDRQGCTMRGDRSGTDWQVDVFGQRLQWQEQLGTIMDAMSWSGSRVNRAKTKARNGLCGNAATAGYRFSTELDNDKGTQSARAGESGSCNDGHIAAP